MIEAAAHADAAPRFSDFLRAVFYSPAARAFIRDDDSLMRIWRLTPYRSEGVSMADKRVGSDFFSRALNTLPPGSMAQLVVLRHTDVRDIVDRYLKSLRQTPVAQLIGRAVAERQLQAARRGFFTAVDLNDVIRTALNLAGAMAGEDTGEVTVDEIRRKVTRGAWPLLHDVYFIVVQPWYEIHDPVRAVKSLVKGADDDIGPYQTSLREFVRRCDRIETALRTAALEPSVVEQDEYVRILYRILNPRRSQHVGPPTVPARQLYELSLLGRSSSTIRTLASRTPVTLRHDGIEVDGRAYHPVSVYVAPAEYTVPDMVASRLPPTLGPHWLCINMYVPNQAFVRAHAYMQLRTVISRINMAEEHRAAGGLFVGNMPVLEEQQEHVEEARKRLSPDALPEERQIALDVTLHVVLDVPASESEEMERVADGIAYALWEAGQRETVRGDLVVIQALPGNLSSKASGRIIRKGMRMLSGNVADLAPLFARYGGDDDPSNAIIVNNGDGAPIYFNLFTQKTAAHHVLVAGGTGSGKSVSFHTLWLQTSAVRDIRVYGLDNGQSSAPAVELVGGTFIPLRLGKADSLGRGVCINPFAVTDIDGSGRCRLPDEEERRVMTDVLAAMARSTATAMRLTVNITPSDHVMLNEALMAAFAEKEGRTGEQVTLSDIVRHLTALQRSRGTENDLVGLLHDYTREGIYGQLFDGRLDVDWNAPAVVFDIRELEGTPALGVAVLVWLSQVRNFLVTLPPAVKKIIFIDEAWAALANPTMAAMVANFYRTLRKYGGSICLISQQVADFAGLVEAEIEAMEQAGKKQVSAILNNTAHFLLFPCVAQDREVARGLLNLTDEEMALWDEASPSHPYYSECFYRQVGSDNKPVGGLIRLYSNPIIYWATTSTVDERAERERLTEMYRDQGRTLAEARRMAIAELARRHPHGLHY